MLNIIVCFQPCKQESIARGVTMIRVFYWAHPTYNPATRNVRAAPASPVIVRYATVGMTVASCAPDEIKTFSPAAATGHVIQTFKRYNEPVTFPGGNTQGKGRGQ